jgi:hypothetical protein
MFQDGCVARARVYRTPLLAVVEGELPVVGPQQIGLEAARYIMKVKFTGLTQTLGQL